MDRTLRIRPARLGLCPRARLWRPVAVRWQGLQRLWLPALLALALGACAESAAPATAGDAQTGPDLAPGGDAAPATADIAALDDVGAPDTAPDTAPSAPEDAWEPPPDTPADDAAPTVDTAPVDAGPPPPAPELVLTVNRVPPIMNGSLPYLADDPGTAFHLRVNRSRFTLDLAPTGAFDPESLSVVCDAPMAGAPSGEPLPAGALVEDGAWWTARIDSTGPGPSGAMVTCTASVAGPGGTASDSLTFESADLPPSLDPFPTPDRWLIVLSRDEAAVTLTTKADGQPTLKTTFVDGGNGVPDLADPFVAVGLATDDAPAAWDWLRARSLPAILAEAYLILHQGPDGALTEDSVPVVLQVEGTPGAPSPAEYDGVAFSMIALGGDGVLADQTGGIVGRALIDWNNQSKEDDTVHGLGIFVTALVRTALPLAWTALVEFLPDQGTPFGLHPSDAAIMAPGFDPATTGDADAARRASLVDLLVLVAGKGLAATLCHEIGHSIGLVPYGPPPAGLFAEVAADFAVTVPGDAHVDTVGPNVMQTGKVTDVMEVLSAPIHFNPLNLAYLRRQLVVGGP